MTLTRFIRHLLVILLVCLFLVYLAHSVSKYNSGLVSVSVRDVPQTSFEFPTIAVCGVVTDMKPESMFNPVGSFPPWIEWAEQHYLEEEEKDRSGLEKRNLKARYIYGVEFDQRHKMWLDEIVYFEKDNYYIGCNFFRPPKTRRTLAGARNHITLKLNNSMIPILAPIFPVGVNHADLLLPISYLSNTFLHLPAFINRINKTESSFHEVMLHINFNEYTYMSRPDRPCRTDKELETVPRDDFKNCTLRYLTEISPPCLRQVPSNCTQKQLKALGSIFDELVNIGELEFFKLLDCYPPCRVPTYDIKVMPTISTTPSPDGKPWVQLTFVAPRPTVTHKAEFLVFDAGAMMGDIGGLMGILLGASILAMYDYLVKLMGRAKKYFTIKQ